jgi:hypothetical protein
MKNTLDKLKDDEQYLSDSDIGSLLNDPMSSVWLRRGLLEARYWAICVLGSLGLFKVVRHAKNESQQLLEQ